MKQRNYVFEVRVCRAMAKYLQGKDWHALDTQMKDVAESLVKGEYLGQTLNGFVGMVIAPDAEVVTKDEEPVRVFVNPADLVPPGLASLGLDGDGRPSSG
jgi:hypothetical protein